LAGDIHIEIMVCMLERGDAQAALHEHGDQPDEQGGLAGTAPAGNSKHAWVLHRRTYIVTPDASQELCGGDGDRRRAFAAFRRRKGRGAVCGTTNAAMGSSTPRARLFDRCGQCAAWDTDGRTGTHRRDAAVA